MNIDFTIIIGFIISYSYDSAVRLLDCEWEIVRWNEAFIAESLRSWWLCEWERRFQTVGVANRRSDWKSHHFV